MWPLVTPQSPHLVWADGRPRGSPLVRLRARSVQGGESPLQVNLHRPVADRNCVVARRGGEQWKANGVVRSDSKLDSAMLTGEPARERRSPDLCEQEAHDAEKVGVKAIMGGSGGMEHVKRGDLRGARGERIPRYRPPQGAERATGRASAQESEHP